MRKWVWVVLLVLAGMLAAGRPALAWGNATHAYVAKAIADDFVPGPRIYRPYLELQFVYGAMAPDLAWVAPGPLRAALGQATHLAPGYDDIFEAGQPSRLALIAFSGGWLTHNEAWGGDFTAHDESDGYVVQRASALAWTTGIPEGLAHDYVEAAVDLLIDHELDPTIGTYLRRAALFRDRRIPGLVADSYPAFDPSALGEAELTFKRAMTAYGSGLALPSPWDDDAAALGLAFHARSAYGLKISLGQSKALLDEATNLVRDDYFLALRDTIEHVRLGLWGWLAIH